MSNSVLVIKLGALGDFFQAAKPSQAIRRHHGGAQITLLTTKPYAAFAESSPWFDSVWIDSRPSLWQIPAWMKLRSRLRGRGFGHVYDLQTSDRSGFYFRFLGPGKRPDWSGIAPGCSHPHANPGRDSMHTTDRQAEQLSMAGLKTDEAPVDFSWVKDETSRFGLNSPYALLAPGGARHRPEKRWPVENFIRLASHLAEKGTQPVLIGREDERPVLDAIGTAQPEAMNLSAQTSLGDLIGLGANAALAIGNDTGPMHPIAMAGCPSLVLFSAASDPALCQPRGRAVSIIAEDKLNNLTAARVIEACGHLAA